MNHNNFPFLFLLFFLVSCKNESVQNQNTKVNSFRLFLNKMEVINLPFEYNYNSGDPEFDYGKLKSIDYNSIDTLFVKNRDGVKCYGLLPDTSTYYSIIYFYPAEIYYPVVISYDKNGSLIDEIRLNLGGCGADCGLERCSEFSHVNQDLSIVSADTVVWEFMCDGMGEPIPKSSVIKIDSKTGHLANDGRFVIDQNNHEEINYKQ